MQDELPNVMSVDAEMARQSLISVDDFMLPPPPAQPVAQVKNFPRGGPCGVTGQSQQGSWCLGCVWEAGFATTRLAQLCMLLHARSLYLQSGRHAPSSLCTLPTDEPICRPLPRSVLPTEQEGGDKASFLHVWQSSYCDNETARNSMESIDVFLE